MRRTARPSRARAQDRLRPVRTAPPAADPGPQPPSALPSGIARRALLSRADELAPDVCLVLLTAPMGFGKSTVARQWADSRAPDSTWLQVDPAHQDPHHLVEDLAVGLLGLGPLEDVLSCLPVPPRDLPAGTAPGRLAAATRAVGRPVLLVLDDVHRLGAGEAGQLVVALADRLPLGSRLVAVSDGAHQLPIGGLLAQGRCVEFGPADLAFTRDETAAVLAAAGLHLPDAAVEEVRRRTAGWPLGLQLVTRTLRSAPDPLAAVADVGGGTRAVVDYFRHVVLTSVSVDTYRFLIRTSMLDRMSGALCDEALEATGSGARLESLETLGLFIARQDDRAEWYRYHPMFADMLRAELRRRDPGEDRRILGRASQWFEDHGDPGEAIRYAIAAGEEVRAARILVAHLQGFAGTGRLDRVRQWIEELDDEVLELYPPLAVVAAWVRALTRQTAAAYRALGIAESASFGDPMPDGSSSLTSAVLRARAALAPDGVDAMLADARCALLLEPAGSPWHPLAAVLLGTAQMLTGATTEASHTLERAVRYAEAEQAPGTSFALAQQALIAADLGDWHRAQVCAQESRRQMEAARLGSFLPSLFTHAATARVALHGGDTQGARRDVATALAVYGNPSSVPFPHLATHAAVVLGRLLLDLDDVDAAARMLDDARRHLALLPTAGALPTWVDSLGHDVRARQARRHSVDVTGLTRAELRVLHLLPTHLSVAEIATQLVVARNTVKSQVAAIYRKLDVASRAQAVQRAEALGLLVAPEPEAAPGRAYAAHTAPHRSGTPGRRAAAADIGTARRARPRDRRRA